MKKLLLLKTGSTLPDLHSKYGDFEDWILEGMGISHENVAVVNVEKGESLPGYDELSGIVITGSHSMVTDLFPWISTTSQWLSSAVDKKMPVLGICFGHQ